eukprot:10573509-Lingulodinium_polyedra.AAC.1
MGASQICRKGGRLHSLFMPTGTTTALRRRTPRLLSYGLDSIRSLMPRRATAAADGFWAFHLRLPRSFSGPA